MKQPNTLQVLTLALTLAAAVLAAPSAQAQENGPQSDLILFGPASNPGGLVGFINTFETNASEFYPAFLPASANVPNNIGVLMYEDPSQTVVSDELWTQAGFWYFASDPSLVNFSQMGITTVGSVIENGTSQDMSAYFLLPPGSMTVMSDIPEPTSMLLLTLGCGSLFFLRRLRFWAA